MLTMAVCHNQMIIICNCSSLIINHVSIIHHHTHPPLSYPQRQPQHPPHIQALQQREEPVLRHPTGGIGHSVTASHPSICICICICICTTSKHDPLHGTSARPPPSTRTSACTPRTPARAGRSGRTRSEHCVQSSKPVSTVRQCDL